MHVEPSPASRGKSLLDAVVAVGGVCRRQHWRTARNVFVLVIGNSAYTRLRWKEGW